MLTLAQVPLLASLPAADMEQLEQHVRRRCFPAGAVFMCEDKPGDSIVFVLSGEVEIVKALGTGSERLMLIDGPGAVLGELSLFEPNGVRTASVRARTDVEAVVMTHKDFEAYLDRSPQVALALLRKLSRRLRQSENATIRDLETKNQELAQAYEALKAAQDQLIEKERMEHELALAQTIQRSFLPEQFPALSGYTLGAVMKVARMVGGDLYDFFRLPKDRLGIVIGDVSGKGAPAALYMAFTSSLMRAEASQDRPPAQVLRRVNRHLLEFSGAPMFVTMLYGVLDLQTGVFTYARAAHELPELFDAFGTTIPVSHRAGQPLGIMETPEIDEQVVAIPPGGCLVMFSDGVTEAADADDVFFGVGGVRRVAQGLDGASAQGVCDAIVQAVVAHEFGNQQHDDITVVAIAAAPAAR